MFLLSRRSLGVIILLISLLYTAGSVKLSVSPSSETLKVGDSVTIEYLVDLEGETFVAFNIKVGTEDIATGQGNDFRVASSSKTIFGDRLTTEYINPDKYRLILTDLMVNDSVTFSAELYSKSGTTVNEKSASITIDVKADAVFSTKLDDELQFNIQTAPILSVIVFAKPPPTFSCKLDTTVIPGSVALLDNHMYNCSCAMPALKVEDCGKKLTYEATNGHLTQRSSNLKVSFTPSTVSNVVVVQDIQNMIYVSWNPIPSGKCNATYLVEYTNAASEVVFSQNATDVTKMQISNTANATSLKVGAIVNGNAGPIVTQRIPPPATTTTTTTTTPSTTKLNPTAAPVSGDDNTGAIVGGVVGVVLLVIVISIIVVCVLKIKSRNI